MSERGSDDLKFKVAVATKGPKGLMDEVSCEFGRARTFTVIDLEDDQVKNVKVVNNPAASYEHGVGQMAIKMLADMKIEVVAAGEFDPGASVLLKDKNIRTAKVKAGTNVRRAVSIVR